MRELTMRAMASHARDNSTQLLRPLPSHSQLERGSWDLRPDGSRKGLGFLGVLERPDRGVMSEFSVADSENPALHGPKGEYLDYPSLVPTLTQGEVSYLLNMREGDTIPQSIYQKAEAFALQRKAQGKPVFAQEGEQSYSTLPMFRRKQ